MKDKYVIKQFILNGIESNQQLLDAVAPYVENKSIIGYLFMQKPSQNSWQEPSMILNLYIVKPRIGLRVVTNEELTLSFRDFIQECYYSERNKLVTLFKNPPIELWLNTKENWCKKVATELKNKFKCTFDDALSEIYFSIVKMFAKKTIYMGSLNYVKRSIWTDYLHKVIHDSLFVMQDDSHNHVCSLETIVVDNGDNDTVRLADIIATPEDTSIDSIEYKSTLKACEKLLSDKFSAREIDQIVTKLNCELPFALQTKLYRWRKNHSSEEIL